MDQSVTNWLVVMCITVSINMSHVSLNYILNLSEKLAERAWRYLVEPLNLYLSISRATEIPSPEYENCWGIFTSL